jgi:hypothetical protein
MPGKKRTNGTAQAWEQAKKTVADNSEALSTLDSHAAIYAWAKENGMATKILFPKFKTELIKQLSIDYDALREQAYTQRRDQIAAAAADGPLIELFTAAEDEVRSYAICGPDGAIVTYGEFHENDRTYHHGDQDSADRSVAEFALFIAGQAREEANATAARLRLHVLNHEVAADDPVLVRAALRGHIDLTIDIDQDSPALEWCRENGYKTWRETRLTTLFADEAVAG